MPDLIDIEQELFELPKKERVIYNKEVQTTPLSDDEYDDPTTILPSRREIEAREREREKEREREREELDEISSQLDLDIEQELRGVCSFDKVMLSRANLPFQNYRGPSSTKSFQTPRSCLSSNSLQRSSSER